MKEFSSYTTENKLCYCHDFQIVPAAISTYSENYRDIVGDYERTGISPIKNPKGWDISVGIATRYGLDGPGIESRLEARFSVPVQAGLGAHPASYTVGTGSFPGIKRPARGFDHPLNLG
jgi:hypothetical protein